jgi:two-component system, sensor histidine kinase PdtaS
MNSVWSRLVTVLLLVVVPIGAVMVLVARDDLNSGLDNLRAMQAAAAGGRAHVLRSWLDSDGRSLSNESAAARLLPADRCRQLVETFLSRNSSFVAARLHDETGAVCAAGALIETPPDFETGAIKVDEDAAYSVIAKAGRVYIAASDAAGATPAIALISPEALKAQLPPVIALGETHIALIDRDRRVIAQSGTTDAQDWLAGDTPPSGADSGWRGPDKRGHKTMFVIAPVIGADMSILMRFDDSRAQYARQRFYLVCALQLALLGLLALAYAATVRRDIVRWIRGVEYAARARARDPESNVLAPVERQMPSELRSVADAFNTMATRALDHQTALKDSLAENRVLMLEMHHRIKNSLQVIQSYLALIRRSTNKLDSGPLLKIESRISVLAVAYRMGLTPGGLRGIPVQPFLEEIGAAAIANLRGPRQLGELSIRWNGELEVDRAIPLGLGLVEALIAGFGGIGATHVAVTLNPIEDGQVRLTVEADGERSEGQPPQRIMMGLAAQLGAHSTTTARLALCWDFRP